LATLAGEDVAPEGRRVVGEELGREGRLDDPRVDVELGLGEAAEKKILWENASRLFG